MKIESSKDPIRGKMVCYSPNMISSNGLWQNENPFEYSLPLFILQLILIVGTTRILVVLLKPLRQPKIVSEILGGVILGPSVLGRSRKFAISIFPMRSILIIETMANVGLLFFLFLVGVEMDLSVVRKTGHKAAVIAIAGMILPFLIGSSTTFLYRSETSYLSFMVFMGVVLSVTAFPVLARILAELKLLNTELGKIAMSAAMINDICAWILLAVGITLAESNSSSTLTSFYVVLASSGFMLVLIFVVRPVIVWMIKRTPKGESFSDYHICLILTGVMVCGFITDAIGTHSILGAFAFGLIIPNGPLAATLMEKLEDFVTALLLPLYFTISGIRTDIASVSGKSDYWFFIFIIILACVGKVAGTLLIALFYKMPFRESFALALFMNTKGLIEMVILNVGRDQKVLDEQSFSTMVVGAVLVTSMITPGVVAIYKPARRFITYKRRTIQKSKPDSDLRVLTCIHNPRNVPTITNLIEISNPTRKSHIFVYALHLVELTGRASAMLIVHNTYKAGKPATNRTQVQSEHIIKAFENMQQQLPSVSVHPLTAISPYSTMHEDICNLAEDKHVTFIILPFHKQQAVDGGMEATNPVLRNLNQNVLANAPCSVGILVDRGVGGSRVAASHIYHHIAVLFFGGPDDREALSYAWRMAGHPCINLTVFRFLPWEDAIESTRNYNNFTGGGSNLRIVTETETQNQLDDNYITNFRLQNVSDETIVYTEKFVNNAEETVAVVRSMDNIHDFYIVGRGQAMISPLTAGLSDWSECPELGAIGDLLASSDSSATVSVLVVQQYAGGSLGDGLGTPDGQLTDSYDNLLSDIRNHNSGSGDSSQPFPLGGTANSNDRT